MACRQPWHWPIRRMATTAVFERGSLNSGWLTRSVSCPTRPSSAAQRGNRRQPHAQIAAAVAGVPPAAPRQGASAGLGQGAGLAASPSMPGSRSAGGWVAMQSWPRALPACACARRTATPSGVACRRRVAADRVAGRRSRAGSLLAFHAASRHHVRTLGRSDQAPLADRARLPRTEAGGRA